MKRISALVLTCMILAGLSSTVYAAQETVEQNENTNTETVIQETQGAKLECIFSELQIERKADHAQYKTTVSVRGADLAEGYEIHVKSENKDDVVIKNKAGGSATKNVYKDGVMYLAVMSGELTGEEIELCEITVNLPYDASESERVLEIPEIQVVTSVAAEEIEVTGPYEVDLPEVKAPFYAAIWFYLMIAAVVLAGGFIFWKNWKKRKGAVMKNRKAVRRIKTA